MDIKGISVVSVSVSDIAGARDFYERVLGLKRPKIVTGPWVEYEMSGANFALYSGGESATPSDADASGAVRFCFEVRDIVAAHQELEKAGAPVRFGPRREYGYHLLEFEDPDGNPVRLIQYES